MTRKHIITPISLSFSVPLSLCFLVQPQYPAAVASTRVQMWGTKRRKGVWKGGVPLPTGNTPSPPTFSQWGSGGFCGKLWIFEQSNK